MAVTPGDAAQHMQPGFREIIGTRLGGRRSYYGPIYGGNVQTTKRSYEDYFGATTLPSAVEKPIGTNIQSFEPREGASKRITQKTYAIGVEFAEETWDDDLYANDGSMLRESMEGLADSGAERVELEAHDPINRAMVSGAYPVLPDETDFIATSHAPVAGGTVGAQSNRPSTDADFDTTRYHNALIQFDLYKDDMGKRIPEVTRPELLLVPPQLKFLAQEVTQNPTRVDTTADIVNFARGEVTPMSDPYITDPDQWLIRAAKHYLYFLWRWRPRLDSFDDRRARVAVHVLYMRFGYAPIHWLGWYGSTGA